jgi:hypothetical protein
MPDTCEASAPGAERTRPSVWRRSPGDRTPRTARV